MPDVKDLLEQNHVVLTALKRFGGHADSLRPIQESERSFVFACQHESGKDAILRITHDSHRTYQQVCGEMDWIEYLLQRDMSVTRPMVSQGGALVEKVNAGSSDFSCVLFETAKGRAPKAEDWNSQLFVDMGRFLGRMHALTQNYAPTRADSSRPTWSEEMEVILSRRLPASEDSIVSRYRDILHYLLPLDKPDDAYGLVHVDFHRGNFFVSDRAITLFDFDDCQYSWFANDIAMALFYAIPMDGDEEERQRLAQQFYTDFMAGYRDEMSIEDKWLDLIPVFLKHRELDLYICQFDECEGDINRLDSWGRRFMAGRKERLENDVPYVEIACH